MKNGLVSQCYLSTFYSSLQSFSVQKSSLPLRQHLLGQRNPCDQRVLPELKRQKQENQAALEENYYDHRHYQEQDN